MFITKLLALASVLPLVASAQVVKSSDNTTILGRKIVSDAEGRVLAWHQPETPGAGYDHVIRLASDFMLHRAPIDPKAGLPMYLTTSSFSKPDLKGPVIHGDDWPNHPACIFAGAVETFAVGYYGYTGDRAALDLVRTMLDHQLAHGTTPAGFAWPGVPYASADPFVAEYNGATKWEVPAMVGDGLHGIEPDKIGELGYAFVRFYEITLDARYLAAACDCADALAGHVRDLDEGRGYAQVTRSPWPFRVNARTGAVISEYCSNVLEPIKLFDELNRIGSQIDLSPERREKYQAARALAWKWLYSKGGPMKTFVWNGYFEDVPNDPDRANRVQITPGELAKHLIRHPRLDPNIDVTVPGLLHWIATVFKQDGWDAINEQLWCYEPMGSHTARYGAVCAMYYERTGNPYYKDQAYRFLNYATYMTLDDGFVSVGPNWPGAWWTDGYTDYIRHYFDALAAIPEWAPRGENRLLRSSSPVQTITYAPDAIEVTTFDTASDFVLRLAAEPSTISAGGVELGRSDAPSPGHSTWKSLESGGIATVHTAGARTVRIVLGK